MNISHFEVNHTAPVTNVKETIKELESIIGGFIFWLENNEFGGRKGNNNFFGKIDQDGSITVEFD